MANTVKETKAQKSERLKRAMNPWDGLAEIRRFAREGFDSIPPEWIGTYFRWWGVYTQGDGGGADTQEVARAGDLTRRAEEGDVHPYMIGPRRGTSLAARVSDY